ELPNEKVVPNSESVNEQALHVLTDVIYNPLLVDAAYDQTIFKHEKETLKQRMRSIVDEKVDYAQMRVSDEMDNNEYYSLQVLRYEKDLEALDAQTLYEYYKSLLTEDELDIYVVGDFDVKDLKTKLTNAFDKGKRYVSTDKTLAFRNRLSISKSKEI